MTYAYRQEWPHADAVRFAVNYVRVFAVDPAERQPRPPRRAARRRVTPPGEVVSGGDTTRFSSRGAATRTRIVDAAAKLMFEYGVAGTSIDHVRRDAAVSGSQIGHYFDDKRDLTRQVIAARRSDVVAFHTQPRLGALDSLRALQAWADACVANVDVVYRRGGCVYGSLVGELLEADDEVLDDVAAGYDQWLALFRNGLVAMRERGDLRADANPGHLATALVTAHQGGALVTYATGSAEPLRAATDAAVDYVRSFASAPEKPRSGKRSQRNARSS
jgi:AcrR family transcriptional regulator